MKFQDYYQILGVPKDASESDIKRAYRKLARKYHPDVSKEADAEERFKEIGEAYAVLKDPEKRVAYDQLGRGARPGEEFTPPPGWDAGFEFSGGFAGDGAEQFSDFFESLFGGRGRRQYAYTAGGFGGGAAEGFRRGGMRGQDHHAKVLISAEDSYHGATRTITLQVPEVTREGHVETKQRTLNVTIPKGIIEGQVIRLAGQGTPGSGGQPAGDLYLEVAFQPHRLFRIDGRDVYLELPITPWEAALGANVKVPTLGGKVDLKIPPGAKSGHKLRLKGRGLPGTQPGDQYVELKIVTPQPRNAEDEALYRKMAEQMPLNPRTALEV